MILSTRLILGKNGMISIATLYQNSLRVQSLAKIGKTGTKICFMSFLNEDVTNVYLPYNEVILQKKNRLR